MNDKTNNPQEKIETAIDSGELRDEELNQVQGGAGGYDDGYWIPLKTVGTSSGGNKRLLNRDAGTEAFWSAEFITD